MITKIKEKIRALVEDFPKSDFETFTYGTSSIFTLSESNITTISKVLKNGNELGTGDYSYDSVTNKIEIISSLTNGDIVEIDYTYNKYSDEELIEYIRASLVWITWYSDSDLADFELENGEIVPTPDNKATDLIALISSIIIKPNYSSYRLPNLTVTYPRRMSKEEKIQRLITKFERGIGLNVVITIE